MEYIELNIDVISSQQAEIITAMLEDYPFEAFSEEESMLKAYIPAADYERCSDEVRQTLASLGIESYSAENIEQQNWNSEWESSFEAVEVAGECPICIRAQHHTPPAEGVMDVIIAPRMSFGTGHHTTTALMSKTIAQMGVENLRGLDMGCGTGVLAIVATKCGAKSMVAVDIDDWACDSCLESIALSGVENLIEVRCGSMEQVAAGEKFDFILANINRNILLSMMPSFAEALDSGGRLVMSGFLEEDITPIEAAAAEQGFKLESSQIKDNWAVVICKRL